MRALCLLLATGALAACSGSSSVVTETTGVAITVAATTSASTTTSGGKSTTASSASGTTAAASSTSSAASTGTTASAGTTQGATTGTTGATTGSTTGAATTSGSFRDPNTSNLPIVTNPAGNLVLNPENVVTVTFASYPYTAPVEALGDYLAASSYIGKAAAEYGLGSMTNTNLETGQVAPTETTDAEIQAWILENLEPLGSLPAPAAGYTPVYVLYYPSTTTVTNELGGVSCQAFSGYHLEAAYTLLSNAFAFYYAVISDCGTGLGDVEFTATHEMAEAASDPDDVSLTSDAWVDRDVTTPWVLTNYITEIADLCEGQSIVMDAGVFEDGGEQTFTLTQLWSDDAALDGGAPCLPVDPHRPYYNVVVDQLSQTVPVGSSATFNLTGWSSGPLPPWQLTAYAWEGVADSFAPTLTLGTGTIGNGQTTTFTIGVPAGTPSGAFAGAYITSVLGDGTYAQVPVLVYAQ